MVKNSTKTGLTWKNGMEDGPEVPERTAESSCVGGLFVLFACSGHCF